MGPVGPLPPAATRVVKARAEMILNCILLEVVLFVILETGNCSNEDIAKTITIFILPDI